MMTPIPARVDDKKDAVLWSVLNALEQIDSSPNSRAIWAQSILFNLSASLDGPAFKEEIQQIKEVLGVKDPEPEVILPPADFVPGNEVSREDFLLRDL